MARTPTTWSSPSHAETSSASRTRLSMREVDDVILPKLSISWTPACLSWVGSPANHEGCFPHRCQPLKVLGLWAASVTPSSLGRDTHRPSGAQAIVA
jgi:hypothetical protein